MLVVVAMETTQKELMNQSPSLHQSQHKEKNTEEEIKGRSSSFLLRKLIVQYFYWNKKPLWWSRRSRGEASDSGSPLCSPSSNSRNVWTHLENMCGQQHSDWWRYQEETFQGRRLSVQKSWLILRTSPGWRRTFMDMLWKWCSTRTLCTGLQSVQRKEKDLPSRGCVDRHEEHIWTSALLVWTVWKQQTSSLIKLNRSVDYVTSFLTATWPTHLAPL